MLKIKIIHVQDLIEKDHSKQCRALFINHKESYKKLN